MVLTGGKTGILTFVMFWTSSWFIIVDVDGRFTVQEVLLEIYLFVWPVWRWRLKDNIACLCRWLTDLIEDMFDISLYLAEQWGWLNL